MKNTNVSSKSNDLISALETHFEKKINLARVKSGQTHTFIFRDNL
jgi:hypothetical protein